MKTRQPGETRKAIEFYEQKLAICREIGYRSGEGNPHFNMVSQLHPSNSSMYAIRGSPSFLALLVPSRQKKSGLLENIFPFRPISS